MFSSTSRTAPLVAAVALFSLVTVSGCASVAPRPEPTHVAYMAAAAADTISTQQALDRGGKEANPLLGSDPSGELMTGLKIGGFLGMRVLEEHIEDSLNREMKWWEKALLWAAPIGIQSYAAWHNSNVGRDGQ